MELIADSGSTKTIWCLLDDRHNAVMSCQTTGINPFFQQIKDIVNTLEMEFTLDRKQVSSIYFYGAGAANDQKKRDLFTALQTYFQIDQIQVDSDLMAAAHGLCQGKEGIAAILGTGSNSCYYDGRTIAQHVSPLGFILGDEGSAAVLGRKLISDVLKNQMPRHLVELFYQAYELSAAEILENVYRKPFPNRYLATFSRFLSANIHEEPIENMVRESFVEFFNRNIRQYPQARRLPVHFTGSIAWYFQAILHKAAQETGFTVGNIIRDPMDGLIEYHQHKESLLHE